MQVKIIILDESLSFKYPPIKIPMNATMFPTIASFYNSPGVKPKTPEAYTPPPAISTIKASE